ncbi:MULTISPECIES: hypothetical protein [Streptomyces]|uniref:Secreted protein n=1 Tax=Streptomyces chilikensis TaxID=1194079 RepID=A0ABV3EK49_9ACTN|nr:hypothetical protein [Streptomyces sp. MJP52]MDH6223103.1 hypothetical protein [Streptomyces sp. MJP52]
MPARTALAAFMMITATALGTASAAPALAAPDDVAVVRAADGLDVHRGKYVTLGGCQTAGQQGIERGHWDRYQCAEGTFFWNLWTNR